MKDRPSQATRRARVTPLDHLRPGARPSAETQNGEAPAPAQEPEDRLVEGAEPAEPVTPGAGDADAVRGKATSSPAGVATRKHLEGSEQGPQ